MWIIGVILALWLVPGIAYYAYGTFKEKGAFEVIPLLFVAVVYVPMTVCFCIGDVVNYMTNRE